MVVVGHGKGQGPQQNKNFTEWFAKMPGWTVIEPRDPIFAYNSIKSAVHMDSPVMFVIHRELY